MSSSPWATQARKQRQLVGEVVVDGDPIDTGAMGDR
jgi:hypothetical protein